MIHLLPLVASWILGAVFLALDGRKRPIAMAAAVALLAILILDVALLIAALAGPASFEVVTGGWPAGVGIRLRVDALSLLFGAMCTGVLAAALAHEALASACSRLFPALILLLSAGLHGAFFTGDLFNFYVFFELSVVSSFALAAYGYGRAEVRGALVYVGLNLLGSVLFLIGVAAVYHATGTLDLDQIGERVVTGDVEVLLVPAALVFVSLSIKLGLFPFHGWVPILYSHARPAVAAALAGALVKIAAYGLLRIGFTALDRAREQAAPVLIGLGAVAAVYGALLAVRRSRPAEVVAYASIMHAGYLVLGFGIGGTAGVVAVVLTALAGSIDKATMFLTLDSRGAGRSLPALVAAASTSGLPLTAGFLAKAALFRAALTAPMPWLVTAALMISSSLVMAAMFRFWRQSRVADGIAGRPGAMTFALAAIVVGLGGYPDLVGQAAGVMAFELVGGAA